MAYHVGQLQPGDVLLMVGGGGAPWDWALDAAIACSEGSPYTHAAQVVPDPASGVRIAEQLWRVQYSPAEKYAHNGEIYRPTRTTSVMLDIIARWWAGHQGRIYGVAEILADAGRLDLHLPFWAHWHPRHYTCSAAVAQGWWHTGWPLTRAPLPSPADLAYSPRLERVPGLDAPA